MDEEVRNPGTGSHSVLMFKRVGLDHGYEDGGGKRIFRVAEASSHVTDNVDDSFPWVLSSVRVFSDSVVSGVEIVLPC